MVKIRPWSPKYPGFATDRREVRAGQFDPDKDGLGKLPWVKAPETSHLHSFQFRDARSSKTLQAKGQGSLLIVRFKATSTSPATEYNYWFPDHDRGLRFFQQMSAAEHPGEIVHQMIVEKVLYEQVRYGAES
jgi:hypothetical protein